MLENFEARKEQVLAARSAFQTFATGSQKDLQQLIDHRLSNLFQHLRSSAWWRDYLPTGDGIQLAALPVLEKSLVQQEYLNMRIQVPGSGENDYGLTHTSGSTGQPVEVMQFIPTYQLQYSVAELTDVIWQDRDISKNLGFLRINGEVEDSPSWGIPYSYLGNTGRFTKRVFLNRSPAELLQQIAEDQLRYLPMKAMAVRLLSLEQLSNPQENVNLNQIMNWADPVSPELRELVQEAFGAKVVDRFSSNEFGFLAIQCPRHDHLHALQLHNYIELLDEQNRPVPRGELGRVVVTALRGFAQPLIRYELGDLARWGDGCDSGITLPVLEPEIVRQRDIFLDSEGRILLPYTDNLPFIKDGTVLKSQFLQFADRIIFLAEFRTAPDADLLATMRIEISERFGLGLLAEVVEISKEQAEQIMPWKARPILRFDAPAPSESDADVLVAMLPNHRL